MQAGFRRSLCLIGLVHALVLGCQLSGRHSYPDDPLLASKQPIVGKVDPSAPIHMASAEPVPPVFPSTLVANKGTPATRTSLKPSLPIDGRSMDAPPK